MASDPDPLKAELVAVWDAAARTYDAQPRHGVLHEDEEYAWRRLAAAILGDSRRTHVPVRRVLDVGTGTGHMAILAAELGHEVVGLDLSEGMLREAHRKAMAANLNIRWELGDAEDPPFAPGTFDVLIARHVVWTLPDPSRAFGAWATLVRPGGLVAILDGSFRRPSPPACVVSRIAEAIVRRRARRDGAAHEYPAEQYARLPLARQRDTRTITRLMSAAGLVDVRVHGLTELERIERAHLGTLERLADRWVRYLATGQRPDS